MRPGEKLGSSHLQKRRALGAKSVRQAAPATGLSGDLASPQSSCAATLSFNLPTSFLAACLEQYRPGQHHFSEAAHM